MNTIVDIREDMGENPKTEIGTGMISAAEIESEMAASSLVPEFKNQMSRNLMIYTFSKEGDLISYQVEMISNNQIKGLLKAEFTKINGKLCLQYDVTSLVPIKKLFERRKINRDDFIFLISQVVELIDNLERYLLDSGGIIFDSKFVFADPQDLKLAFTYIPVIEMPCDLEDIKGFLLNLIVNDISFVDEPSDNYVRKLIEALKAKEFSISTLKDYLAQINDANRVPKNEPKKEIVKSKGGRILSSTQSNANNLAPNEPKVPLFSNNNKEVKLPTFPEKNVNDKIPTFPGILSRNPIKKVNELIGTTKLCYPPISYIILFSVIGALIIFGVTLILTEVMSPINPDFLLSLFGFILIGGAIIYLIYSKLFTFDKKVERTVHKRRINVKQFEEQHTYKGFPVPVRTQNNDFQILRPEMRESKVHNNPSTRTVYETNRKLAPQDAYETKKRKLAPQDAYETKRKLAPQDGTVILNAGSLTLPHLKRIIDNTCETIVLKSFPFMIGRLDEQVDYCLKNPAIGKLHAEITKTSEGYFISDINSKNGTFINGERIGPGKENLIQNEDQIALGNELFIFYIKN